MISRGITVFLHKKNVSLYTALSLYLQYLGITNVKMTNHNKINKLIDSDWTKFATFIDKSIKSGKIKGNDIKLNTYYDEQRQYKEQSKQMFNSLSDEERFVYTSLKKLDDYRHYSIQQSFFNKKGVKLPSNTDGLTKIEQVLPRVVAITQSEYYEEFKEHLITLLKQDNETKTNNIT
jgi:hypothetical protein